jgi:uncharacterized protein CbrC (UPF0167 family)
MPFVHTVAVKNSTTVSMTRTTANCVMYGRRRSAMTKIANTAKQDQINLVNPTGNFRLWVQELWYTNCDERLIYGEDPVTIVQYWNTYKWWLKREYRQRNEKH